MKYDFKYFLRKEYVITCSSQEDAKLLSQLLQDNNINWANGDYVTDKNMRYELFESGACYSLKDEGLYIGSLLSFKMQNRLIIEMKDIAIKDAYSLRDFLAGDIACNCITKDDDEKFLSVLNDLGLKYNSGLDLTYGSFWSITEDMTCYYRTSYGRIMHTDFASLDEFAKIVRFEDLNL